MSPMLFMPLHSAKKIAVVRACRLGDFVCATPALRALRAAAPQAEIAMITLPLLRDLVTRLPYISRFIAFPGFPGIAQQFFNPHTAVEFFRRIQAERFDLAIQLQGSGVYSNPFTLMLGASATVGFARQEDDATQLAATVVWPERGHEIDRLLALMQLIGAEPKDRETEFPLLEEDRRAGAELLTHLPRPVIGLHAGSHDPRRRWPVEHFITVAHSFLKRYGGTVVVFGGLYESDCSIELTAAIGPGAYNITGRTSLGTLGAVIAQFDLLLTNDSGPAHIGYALGTPTITIYRTGGMDRYGPPEHGPFIGLEPHTNESEDAALAIVSVQQVLSAVDRFMSIDRHLRTEISRCMSESPLTQSAR